MSLFYEKQNDHSASGHSSFNSGMKSWPNQSVFGLINSNNKIRITTRFEKENNKNCENKLS